MSKVIETKLKEVYAKLQTNETNLAISKKGLADALRFNGITNVSDTETFARYAELIRRLKSANAMILEFTIPSTATTAYKRTVILPMSLGTAGSTGASYNSIAKEVIAGDTSTYATPRKATRKSNAKSEEEHLIEDMYGNIITDGTYVAPITMEDVHEYLTDEQAEEFLEAADNLGISLMSLASEDEGNEIMGLSDDNSAFEPDATATYSYTVDWGDGTGEFIYRHTNTYEQNKGAIWHTYTQPGVYNVTINGVFKRLYSNTTSWSNWVENGDTVKDTDGTVLLNGINYNMRYALTSVIAWGNTLLNNMANAFCYCQQLTTIPMYDTTNSFIDVTNLSYAFYRCVKLTSLPFNANTNKGLFSGCDKVTDFTSCFAYCSGIKSSIPIKLMDGCTNVTSVANMFGYAGFTGDIPVGLLEGMTSLTNASEMFANCNLSGELSADLFKDCPNITSIYRLFYGCQNVTGQLTRDFIGGLSKLTDMRQAFYNCKGITGFSSDAFYNIKSDGINCRDAFYGSGVTEIPSGLLSAMTGKNLMMERMFGNCVSLTSVASTELANLKVANARGIFGGCTNLASALPSNNPDWNSLEGMSRWYGAFAKTTLSDINTVCIELGGNGNRKFPEGKVGMILLKDGNYVEGKNYVYAANNKPLGVVYADVYIDSNSNSTIANGIGNVVSKDASNAKRRIFVTVFNDTTRQWTNGQVNAENITTITDTSNVEVSYNKYTWSVDGSTATLNPTRYNGEAYTKAINDWRVSKGMATLVDGIYTKTSTDKYDVVDYVMAYNGVEGTNVQQLGSGIKPFLPDTADLWDQFTMKYFIQKIIDYVIAGGNGYTSSNCYAMRDGTGYWASAEYSQTVAWLCYTGNALCGNWDGKWISYYVRPSLAIDVA